jgi:hypothetical protein
LEKLDPRGENGQTPANFNIREMLAPLALTQPILLISNIENLKLSLQARR